MATATAAADPSSDSLKAAIFQRLHPRVYLERFLTENVRPDGRAIGCVMDGMGVKGEIWRDVSINVGTSFSFRLCFFLHFHSMAIHLSLAIYSPFFCSHGLAIQSFGALQLSPDMS